MRGSLPYYRIVAEQSTCILTARPRYRKKTAPQSTESFTARSTPWPWPGELVIHKSSSSMSSPSETESATYSRSLRQTLQEVKMVQVRDLMNAILTVL